MPTGGSARFASPLSLLDFVRWTSLVALDSETTARLVPAAQILAQAEGLGGHAQAARHRLASEA
jgi:histidinol dehydrogenase